MYWPYLHLYIDIPFIQVKTVLMKKSDVMMTFEYITLVIRIHKWSWEFSLYRPGYSLKKK